jgi:DNA-binding response OmpR family regulator
MTPTILCVDDDDGMTRMLHDALTPRGFKVVSASTVEQAVQVASHLKIDLIVLDLLLPDAEGLALFERLKNETENGQTPVIMVSGCATVENRNRASVRGAVAYLQKPFHISQLLSVIKWAAPAPDATPCTPQ